MRNYFTVGWLFLLVSLKPAFATQEGNIYLFDISEIAPVEENLGVVPKRSPRRERTQRYARSVSAFEFANGNEEEPAEQVPEPERLPKRSLIRKLSRGLSYYHNDLSEESDVYDAEQPVEYDADGNEFNLLSAFERLLQVYEPQPLSALREDSPERVRFFRLLRNQRFSYDPSTFFHANQPNRYIGFGAAMQGAIRQTALRKKKNDSRAMLVSLYEYRINDETRIALNRLLEFIKAKIHANGNLSEEESSYRAKQFLMNLVMLYVVTPSIELDDVSRRKQAYQMLRALTLEEADPRPPRPEELETLEPWIAMAYYLTTGSQMALE